MSDLTHARLVGRVEFRRSVRRARGESNMLVGLVFTGLVLGGGTVAAAAAAVVFGERLATLGAFGRSMVRAAVVSLWFFAAVMVAFRAVGETGRVDGAAGVLTATSPRAVVLGLVLAELYRVLAYVGGPFVVVAGALAVGTGRPLVALAVLAVAAAAVATGVAVGYLVGLVALSLSATVPFVRRNRLTLGGLLMVAYLAAILAFGDLVVVLAGSPLAWLGDAVLLALGAGGDPLHAGVGLLGAVVVVPAAVVAATRVAIAAWYADPPAADDEGDAGTLLAGVDELLAPVAARQTVAVARKTLLRARRAPYTLTFALVPAFAAVGYVGQAVRTGEIPASFPVLAAAYAGWGVGSAFTLNPVGDEGAVLPVTLSTGVSGRAFVRGRVLAAWLVGLPVALVAVAGAAVAAGVPAWRAAGAVAFGLEFAAGTPLVAAGIGTAFPKFDTRTVLASREAVVPSVFAFGLFVLALAPLGAPAVLALTLGPAVAEPLGLAPGAVGALGVAVTGLLTLAAGGGSYLVAVRRFDGYSLD